MSEDENTTKNQELATKIDKVEAEAKREPRLTKVRKGELRARFKQAADAFVTDPMQRKLWDRVVSQGFGEGSTEGSIANLSLEEYLALPKPELDDHVSVLLNAGQREHDEEVVNQYYRVWYDGEVKHGLEAVPIPAKIQFSTALTEDDLLILNQDVDLKTVYDKLLKKYDSFINLEQDIDFDLMALGAMSTYFREVFETTPYFDFTSSSNAMGKTVALYCLIYASYHGICLKNPTDAVLFRLVDATRGALGLDEVEKLYLDPKGNANQLQLLDGGYKKGVDLYRVDMDQHGALINYDGFGLKAFTHVGGIPGGLYNRCIVIVMFDNKGRKKISLSRPTPETFKEIRAQLYSYRLRHSDVVKATYEALLKDETLGIHGRTAELFLPLLTIAKLIDQDLFDRVLEYARKDSVIKDQMKQNPIVKTLVSVLQEEVRTGEKIVSEIRSKLNDKLGESGLLKDDKPLSSQRIMALLDDLGFKPTINEHGKSKRIHNLTMYTIEEETLEKDVAIYLSEEDKTELKKPKFRQTALDMDQNKEEDTTSRKLPKLVKVSPSGEDADADSKSVSADQGNFGNLTNFPGGIKKLLIQEKTRVVDGQTFPVCDRYRSRDGENRVIMASCRRCGDKRIYILAPDVRVELCQCAKGGHDGLREDFLIERIPGKEEGGEP